MMKTSRNLIFLGLLVCLFLTGQAFATDRYVNGQPNSSHLGLYETIQAAVTAAVETDNIYIYDADNTPPDIPGALPGLEEYNGEVVVDVNNLTFIGVGDNVVISEGSAKSYQTQTAFDISGTDGLSFTNMTVQNYLFAFSAPDGGGGVTNLSLTDMVLDNNGADGAGIHPDPITFGGAVVLYGCDDGLFDNLIVSNGERGIRFATETTFMSVQRNTISNCHIFKNEQYGIYIKRYDGTAADNVITGNFVYGNADRGIQFWGSPHSNLSVTNNTVYDNWNEGILLNGGSTFTITGNILTNNATTDQNMSTAGESNDGSIRILGNSSNGTIADNEISTSGKEGICFNGIAATNVDVYDNEITGSVAEGILVACDLGSSIYDNNIQFNDIGISVTGTCTGTLRIYNNCLNNNVSNSAWDITDYTSPYPVLWYASGGPGNFYAEYTGGAFYPIPGGNNEGHYPLTATNTPTGPNDVALGEILPIDFVYSMAADCNPFENLKACHFKVTFDENLLTFDGITDGGYLPNVEILTDASTPGELQVDLTALGEESYATDYFGTLVTIDFLAASDQVGTTDIEIHSEYIDKDGNPITTTSPIHPVEVKDVNPPTIDVAELVESPTGDATYSAHFPLVMDWTVDDDFDLYYFHWRVVDVTGAPYAGYNWAAVTSPYPRGSDPVSGQSSWDISGLPGSGTYYLELWLRDAPPAYNEDYWEQAKGSALEFKVDFDPPTPPNFTITDEDGCAEAGFTSQVGVHIHVDTDYESDPTDKGKVQWAYTGDHRDIIDFTYDFDVNLDEATYGVNTTHTLYLQVTDVYGNTLNWGTSGIFYKTTTPNANLFSFNVPTRTKVLTFNATVASWGGASATAYAYSVNDNGDGLTCKGADWQAIFWPIAPFSVTIPGTDPQDGDYEFFFRTRDAAGNMSDIVSDIIELDRTAPQFSVFTVGPVTTKDDPIPCSDSWTIAFHVEFDPAFGEVYRVGIYVADMGNRVWYNIPASATSYDGTYTISSPDRHGEGLYTIHAQIRDLVGNYGDEEDADIYIDWINPVPGAVYVEGAGSYPWAWSDDADVIVTLPDASDDIIYVRLREGSTGDFGAWQEFDGSDPASEAHLTLTGNECDYIRVYVEAKDCAENVSGAVYGYTHYDIQAPVVEVLISNGAEKTKWLTNYINMNITENCSVTHVMISEDPDFQDPAKGHTDWVAYSPTHTHVFYDPADGQKIVYVKVKDAAGHEGADDDDILLDRAKPSGVLAIVAPGGAKGSGCPGAAGGYTCTLYDNILTFSDVSADVVKIQIQNSTGSGNTGWIDFDPATTQIVWDHLAGGGEGNRCVQFKFKDDANNETADWISAYIYYDPNPPTWTSITAEIKATPTGEGSGKAALDFPGLIKLSWDAHPEAQFYGINWDRTTDYPIYASHPTFPPTIESDFQGPHDITDNPYVFETIGLPGIYYMSLFLFDMAGNPSTDALNIATQNYYGGDFELWGGLRIEDFLTLAEHYFTTKAKGDYSDVCDIGPTSTGWIDGYTLKDGDINFQDLLIFTFNYDHHMLADKGGSMDPFPFEKVLPNEALIVSAELPTDFRAGQEFSVAIQVNQPAVIKAMSLTFEYDNNLLEAVSIKPGGMFEKETAVQLNRINGSSINIDGAILGAGESFEANEIACINFRARHSGNFEFSDPLIQVVDRFNEDVDVSFSNVFNRTEAIPTAFALSQNYPNPFNPATNIDFSIPVACEWKIDIYNIAGQLVKAYSGYDEPGMISITWDGVDEGGSSVASGIYFYKATADHGRFTQTKKMVFMK